MQISIETHGSTDEIDFVTVSANGAAQGKALLNRLLPQATTQDKRKPAPEACTLREAAELLRAMGNLDVPNAYGEARKKEALTCRHVAALLEELADGSRKIQTIKSIREVSGLGLKEAKALTETIGPFREIGWRGEGA